MPSECQESKQLSEGYPQLSDEVGYRVAGNAVPVPYFKCGASANQSRRTKAHRQEQGLNFEDLSLVESAEVTLGTTLEECEEIQRGHNKFV